MKVKKNFSLWKKAPEKGLEIHVYKSYESWTLFRIPYWRKLEKLISKWKHKEEGFPSLEEIEDLLHGRW